MDGMSFMKGEVNVSSYGQRFHTPCYEEHMKPIHDHYRNGGTWQTLVKDVYGEDNNG
jgi:hypothetical protein